MGQWIIVCVGFCVLVVVVIPSVIVRGCKVRTGKLMRD
jgi:hypothetical protein